MPSDNWLSHLLLKSASELERADKTIFRFSDSVRKVLEEKPLQSWELDLWARGLKTRLIRMEHPFFRIGTGKRSSLSFFIRNDQGRLVGLRRESITQGATYVTLITDFGYPRESTRFETGWMDVAVFDPQGNAFIYAENKAAEKTLQKLCNRLQAEFREGVPFTPGEEIPKDDALMKAQHIWQHRPTYFWGVSPTFRQAYRVRYEQGIVLESIEGIPSSLEWTT